MRRVLTIGLAFSLVTGAVVGAGILELGPKALETGRSSRAYREDLRNMMGGKRRAERVVVWIGDSTLWTRGWNLSYASRIAVQLRRRRSVESREVVMLGSDFFNYYFLMGEVLKRDPDVVVLIAHLRLFHGWEERVLRNDLCSMIPLSELPRALRLPMHAHGLSRGRLFLCPLLGLKQVERMLYRIEGFRAMFQQASWWGPPDPQPVQALRDQMIVDFLQAYDVTLREGDPVVQMVGATVEMAVRQGVRVLVVGVPIPYEAMQANGLYDEPKIQSAFQLVRNVVEKNGGTFLDLHLALDESGFRDPQGHYTESGSLGLTAMVGPVLLEMLDEL